MKLKILPYQFNMYKITKDTNINRYINDFTYCFIGSTPYELSVITEGEIDNYISKTTERLAFELQGTFEFSEENIGITAKLSSILANVGISLCFVGTYDTDYVMINVVDQDKAVKAFNDNGITTY